MRLLLPGFFTFLIWSAGTLVLYERWFLHNGPGSVASLTQASEKSDESDPQLGFLTPDKSGLSESESPEEWVTTEESEKPFGNIVSALPAQERLNLVPGPHAGEWVPDASTLASLGRWAVRLSAQPNSGMLIFCNYSQAEGPLLASPGTSIHPATVRANAIRRVLFNEGIQPARSTIVFRLMKDSAITREGYAQLAFVSGDPVPWSAELAHAQDGASPGAMLLTRHWRFDYGSSSLPEDPQTNSFFENFTDYLNRHPEKSVSITGHTCDISSAGFNERLGAARAASVKQRLVELGIAADRLQAYSAGEDQPIGENSSAAGQQANRRVELLIR